MKIFIYFESPNVGMTHHNNGMGTLKPIAPPFFIKKMLQFVVDKSIFNSYSQRVSQEDLHMYHTEAHPCRKVKI